VFDDVFNFFSYKSKVDGNQHSSISADTKKCREQSSRVLANYRHTRTLRHTKSVESGCLSTSPTSHLCIRQCAPGTGWLIWFVDNGYSVSVHLLGTTEVIHDG
jgi:hypothetical protein